MATDGLANGGELRGLPIAREVARRLKRRIAEGAYRPHSFLPSERQLAELLKTSRVTVTTALRELEREGLVARTPGRGTRVLPLVDRLARPRIGLIHGELSTMDHIVRQDSLRTLQGARDTLDQLGYEYVLSSVPMPHQLSAEHFLKDFGAILFIEGSHGGDGQLMELERQKAPVVVAKLEVDVDVCATWVDHEEPMRQAVRTLASLGHQRIAFAGRESTYGMHGKARAGYLRGLQEVGLAADDSLIAVCQKTDALSGFLAGRSLLRSSASPTAIVCARDSIAEGVCRAIQEMDLILGKDVSVIGFDDTTWLEGREFLTTFREACYEMGAVAAEMLVERIVNGWIPPEKRSFETPFLLRRTAGPLIRHETLTRPFQSASHTDVDRSVSALD
jgi:LacI family transcriptional regulator